jgi:hypothetical protein
VTLDVRVALKEFVQARERPTVADLLLVDGPDFRMTSHLISTLAGLPAVLQFEPAAKVVQLRSPSGQLLLRAEKLGNGDPSLSGDYAHSMRAMLMAIRIHEVESYDWVYLPPEMRKARMASASAQAGTTPDEFRRLYHLWVP